MDPISINPNPKFDNSLYLSPFLSNPAARPTGFGNLIPITSFSRRGDLYEKKSLRIKEDRGM